MTYFKNIYKKQIAEFIESSWDSDETNRHKNVMVVTGEWGSGKSYLVEEVVSNKIKRKNFLKSYKIKKFKKGILNPINLLKLIWITPSPIKILILLLISLATWPSVPLSDIKSYALSSTSSILASLILCGLFLLGCKGVSRVSSHFNSNNNDFSNRDIIKISLLAVNSESEIIDKVISEKLSINIWNTPLEVSYFLLLSKLGITLSNEFKKKIIKSCIKNSIVVLDDIERIGKIQSCEVLNVINLLSDSRNVKLILIVNTTPQFSLADSNTTTEIAHLIRLLSNKLYDQVLKIESKESILDFNNNCKNRLSKEIFKKCEEYPESALNLRDLGKVLDLSNKLDYDDINLLENEKVLNEVSSTIFNILRISSNVLLIKKEDFINWMELPESIDSLKLLSLESDDTLNQLGDYIRSGVDLEDALNNVKPTSKNKATPDSDYHFVIDPVINYIKKKVKTKELLTAIFKFRLFKETYALTSKNIELLETAINSKNAYIFKNYIKSVSDLVIKKELKIIGFEKLRESSTVEEKNAAIKLILKNFKDDLNEDINLRLWISDQYIFDAIAEYLNNNENKTSSSREFRALQENKKITARYIAVNLNNIESPYILSNFKKLLEDPISRYPITLKSLIDEIEEIPAENIDPLNIILIEYIADYLKQIPNITSELDTLISSPYYIKLFNNKAKVLIQKAQSKEFLNENLILKSLKKLSNNGYTEKSKNRRENEERLKKEYSKTYKSC